MRSLLVVALLLATACGSSSGTTPSRDGGSADTAVPADGGTSSDRTSTVHVVIHEAP